MMDSLLDETLSFCREALFEMPESPRRTQLGARFDVLEQAAARPFSDTSAVDVVHVAKLVLALRDEIVEARRPSGSRLLLAQLLRAG